jgi:hypothetical protein
VGLLYSEALTEFIDQYQAAFDFLEVIPDTLWLDDPMASSPTYSDNRAALARLDAYSEQRIPIVLHSTGLSIGSDAAFDEPHAERIASWWRRFQSPWHSDHLATFRVKDLSGSVIDVGFPMPVPYDRAALACVADRVRQMQDTIPVPFLLENNVYYFETPEQEMTEPEFLNELCVDTGCGLLLDLHNLHTNANNHGFDAEVFLDTIDLERVVEIHIAGGHEFEGVWLDSHSGICPERVWDFLAQVLPRAQNVAGLVFEVFPTWYSELGETRLRGELDRARQAWVDAGKELPCR